MALSLKSSANLFSRAAKISNRKSLLCKKKAYCPIASAHVSLSKYSTSPAKIFKSKDHIDAVTGVTVPEFLWSKLEKWSNAPAFECGVSGRKYTHGQIYQLSRSFGTALKQHGLKRPNVVGILLPNLPEFPIALLGSWVAGLTVTTVNPIYKPEEIAKQMIDSEAKVLVTISDFAPLAKAVQKLAPGVKSIITIGEPIEDCHSFFEMVKADSSGVEFAKGSQIDTTDEVAGLLYSSGTTGPPKGVMLTHSVICSNLFQITQPGYVAAHFFENGNPQERFLGILPFFHSFGFTCVMSASMYQGGFCRTLPRFDPTTFVRAFREHKPTNVHLVPPIISFIGSSPDFTKKEFESIIAIMGGAAPIGEAVITRLLEKADKYFFFQEGYGMTETGPVTHLLPEWTKNKKIGSTGVLVPGTQCKLVDPSTGESVGRNEAGEICVKGPQIMKGYFKNEKATAETIDEEGWLHTGDIAKIDDEDCFYIVDRIKELIKVKGLQVAPSELEDLLRGHPDIADCAVISIPNEKTGELPRAYVVKKRDSLSEDEVKHFIAEKVSDHKHLKGGVEFIQVIPKAISGKILRRELKAAYLENAK